MDAICELLLMKFIVADSFRSGYPNLARNSFSRLRLVLAHHFIQESLRSPQILLRIYANRVVRCVRHINCNSVFQQAQLFQAFQLLERRGRQCGEALQCGLAIGVDAKMLAVAGEGDGSCYFVPSVFSSSRLMRPIRYTGCLPALGSRRLYRMRAVRNSCSATSVFSLPIAALQLGSSSQISIINFCRVGRFRGPDFGLCSLTSPFWVVILYARTLAIVKAYAGAHLMKTFRR